MKIPSVVFVGAVALLAISAAAYPIYVKGEPAWQDYLSLIQARNKALAGTYAYESADGIYLSSGRAGADAVETSIPNALTPIIYGKIFQWFGFNQRLPIYFGIGLFALSTILVSLLGARLAGAPIGAVAGGLFALIPMAVSSASTGGSYEFGMFFFLAGLCYYLGSRRGAFAAPWGRLVLAGILFALAALARNAFAISLVPLVGYDLFVTRSLKRFSLLAIPIALLFGSTLTPYSWLGVGNGYLGTQHQPFQQVGHFFNDPYSATYDRDASIQRLYVAPEGLDRVAIHFARQWGFHVTLAQQLRSLGDSLTFYVSEILPPWEFGGPLLLALAAGGFVVLWRKDRRLIFLMAAWFVFWLAYLTYDRTGNWDHYLEILFPFVLASSCGILWLYEAMLGRGVRSAATGTLIALAVVGTLVYGAKWRFGQQYDNPAYVRGVLARKIVGDYTGRGTVAVGIHGEVAYTVAYTTNRDVIYFHPDTVQALAQEGKLRDVFRKYGVTLAVGFDSSLSGVAGVPVIAVP